MKVFTMGFTRKTAEHFFGTLAESGAKRLIDVRLNNVSQLAGFAKRNDLQYFLKTICGMDYVHEIRLAPTQELLDSYRKGGASWDEYEERFLKLMEEREIETAISAGTIEDACLLCSEETAEQCHRRLVAEYLARRWGDIEIVHLG